MPAMLTQSTSEIASQVVAAQASQTSTISKWVNDRLSKPNQELKSTTNRCHQDNQFIKELKLTIYSQDQSEVGLTRGLKSNCFK